MNEVEKLTFAMQTILENSDEIDEECANPGTVEDVLDAMRIVIREMERDE